jgi:hypothetical protein
VHDTATLDSRAARFTRSRPTPRFATLRIGDPCRADVEAFIAAIYERRYGARIAEWAPTLVASFQGGRVSAAAGYRRSIQPLFLERYLDRPIERAITECTGERVSRAEIVEVGHFASSHPGEGRRLMLPLAQHLSAIGCRWVVSTTTQALRTLMCRLGLAPLAIGAADPRRLGAGAEDWGRYYDHAPVVVAGHLPRSLATLEKQCAA